MTVSLDGGGVLPDQPLPDTAWLRISPTGDPADDIRLHVADGLLHLAGQYARLCVRQTEPHRITVETTRAG